MSEPFLSEIRLFGFSFAPRGWADCDGQILPISMNQALFSLLGTTYGGDGRTTFALPGLRGRTPMHVDPSHRLGQRSGAEGVPLSVAQIPAHSHGDVTFSEVTVSASSQQGTSDSPVGNALAVAPADPRLEDRGYSADAPDAAMADGSIDVTQVSPSTVGGGLSHPNMAPFLTVRFCIALQGVFPSRN